MISEIDSSIMIRPVSYTFNGKKINSGTLDFIEEVKNHIHVTSVDYDGHNIMINLYNGKRIAISNGDNKLHEIMVNAMIINAINDAVENLTNTKNLMLEDMSVIQDEFIVERVGKAEGNLKYIIDMTKE